MVGLLYMSPDVDENAICNKMLVYENDDKATEYYIVKNHWNLM